MRMAELGPLAIALLVLTATGPFSTSVEADEPEITREPAASVESGSPHPLDLVSANLSALRFERALEDLGQFLSSTEPDDPERLRALVLRSQANVALGRFDAAERDYREILQLRPGFRPDAAATPRRAMDRFEKVSRELVGRVRLALVPATARVSAGGVDLVAETDGTIALLAGEQTLLIAAPGFDAARLTLQVPAGGNSTEKVILVPNARSVVFRTEPEGVEILVDGVLAGTTSRNAEAPHEAAQLVVEHLPLGEHQFELRRSCFRTERRQDVLSADLLDPTPRVYSVIALVPVRASIELTGGVRDSEVRIDGVSRGKLPLSPVELCPGEHAIEVERGGRLLWRSIERLVEGEDRQLWVTVRPNALVLGRSPPPEDLVRLGEHFNLHFHPDGSGLAAGAVDTWEADELPLTFDLVFAAEAESSASPGGAWHLHSPVLGARVHGVPLPRALGAPEIERSLWGFSTADSRRWGPAVVVSVLAGGAAEQAGLRVGERVVSLGGEPVRGAAELSRRLTSISPAGEAVLGIDGPEGRRSTTLRPTSGLRLPAPGMDSSQQVINAAWLRAIAASEPGTARAAAALAGLAWLLGESGRSAAAIDTWRRVEWPERAGLSRGTGQYFLGRELQRAGRTAEAAAALREAASSEATAWDDTGPTIAPAARDRLTDLGHAR